MLMYEKTCVIPITLKPICNKLMSTVNSEIFPGVLISRNFTYAKFHEKQKPREMAKSLCQLLI